MKFFKRSMGEAMGTEKLSITRFDSAHDNQPRQGGLTWHELKDKLTAPHKAIAVPGLEKYLPLSKEWKDALDKAKKAHPLFSPVLYKPNTTRGNANIESVSCFVADLENLTPSELTQIQASWAGLAWCLYTSVKHRPEAPRLRVVFPLASPVPVSEWPRVWQKLTYHLTDNRNDPATKDAARMHFLPIVAKGEEENAGSDFSEGALLDPASFEDPPAFERVADLVKRGPVIGASSTTGSGKPGQDFNEKATHAELLALLQKHGWEEHSRKGNCVYVTRPGKDTRAGVSGVIGWPGDPSPVFHCFTSSFPGLEARSYAPFGLLGTLEHGGRFDEAARELGKAGYGEKPVRATTPGSRERSAEEKEDDAERAKETFVGVAGGRVEIESIARQDREILADTWKVLKAANERVPTIFVNQRGEARLFTEDLNGNPYTQTISSEWLSHVLRELADWVKLIPKGRGTDKTWEVANARFPGWIPRDILSGDTKKAALPYLRAVVGCPVVTAAGDLLTKPGYDKASGLYLVAPETRFDAKATPTDAKEALSRLMALFVDFPFASEGDRANAAALLLTPFLRHYISGPAPLFVVEAPTPGTGKTLLASALLSISTPGFTFTDGPSERERGASEEWSKHLGAILAENPSAILLDNLRGMISSGTLEGFLTNPGKLKLRILGKSEMQEVDASGVTMAATGNNALFQHDMTRRSCFIRLDADMERPEDRTSFSISDLLGHVKAHRAEILADVVTILSVWLSVARPEGSAKKGSFERWAGVLSGVLELCGVSQFLSTDSERAAASDPEADTWRGFFQEWGEKYLDPQPTMDGKRRTKSVTAKELTEISTTRRDDRGAEYTQTAPGLAIQHEVVPERSSSKSVGKRLQAARGRVFGGWRLCVGDDTDKKIKVYWLEESTGFTCFTGFDYQATQVNEVKKTDIQCKELQQNPVKHVNPVKDESDEPLDDPFAPGGFLHESSAMRNI